MVGVGVEGEGEGRGGGGGGGGTPLLYFLMARRQVVRTTLNGKGRSKIK